MTTTALWGAILLLGAGPAVADLPAEVAKAFANMHSDLACDYSRTVKKDDEVHVERFEENGGQPGWTLLAVDGEPPSKGRLKKYAKQAEQRSERQNPSRVKFDELAQPGSYRLLEEDAQRAVYEFKPLAEDEEDEDIVPSLTGRLFIDKDTSRVAAFEVTNFESFSPAGPVTIHDMKQTVEFEPLSPGGAMVSRRIETRMEGRLFGFKKISDHQLITFDDFDCR